MILIVTLGCVVLLSVAAIILDKWKRQLWDPRYEKTFEVLGFGVLLALIASVILLVGGTVFYGTTYQRSLYLTGYYENIAKPFAIAESDNILYVGGIEPAIWQAGDYSLASYNSELYSYRHWQQVPVFGWYYYPLSDEIKHVQVQAK